MSVAAVLLLLIIALAVSPRFRRICKDLRWLLLLLLLLPVLLVFCIIERWTTPRSFVGEGFRRE